MCDQLDGRGCEVVDEKDQIISDLKNEIEMLQVDMIALIDKIEKLDSELWKRNSLNVVME